MKEESFALSEITNYVLSIWFCAAVGRSSEAGTLSLHCGKDNEESASNSFNTKADREKNHDHVSCMLWLSREMATEISVGNTEISQENT